jgi:hypothetical protein
MQFMDVETKIEEEIFAIINNKTRITASGFLGAKLISPILNFAR